MIDKLKEVIEGKKEKNKRLYVAVGCTCRHAGQEEGTRKSRNRGWDETRQPQRTGGGSKKLLSTYAFNSSKISSASLPFLL